MFNTLLIPLEKSTLVKNMIKKLPQILEISGKTIVFTHISEPFAPMIYTETSLGEYRVDEKTHRKSCEESAKKNLRATKKYLRLLLQ
jgi:hypothetical protein